MELETTLSERDKEIERLKSQVSPKTTNKAHDAKTSENEAKTAWRMGEFTAYYPANSVLQGGTVTAKGDNLCDSLYYNGYQIVAAPPELPFDTVLEIDVDGQLIKAIVRDRGGAIKGNKFDIAVPNKTNAYDFGRKTGKWRIVE
ncbi:3D domain-containing protein [Listeria cossartiae subsp. cayugensis]|uniref:3D domain-containing protein n=1 Tax=Listeria cossartiae subsp. cayugensis TaxID=2713505 RepID=A0ABU2IIW1_9LIST|nr:3D domain-containing protein [Listeria cossartiae]MDT0064619.1 3D domain-containing protein [Listeria cossartiae subsp. cayugensis]MDT0079777.1 3D domain-containing protein [Listeria cossartiae subsp. cayugensis]MDT0082613.1 3D domain-containing protein [Listeria cossartiae subsp. cayugensis]MDT0086852.1 3D domain-containing protein [Listeria cossartiae subsp. cayugensis]MDT0099230.1 3D domain-containing protein [Listeria cossartiae subsp. cayugensis]